MTEDKDTKKPAPAKRPLKRFFLCVKWLLVIILIVLLVGGIYFQAPLKVLTLIAVFLTALTILPKPLRKYFWLTAGCVFLILVIWIFLPDDDNGEWKPYTLDEEIAKFNSKRVIPDEQNAAKIYNQLLETYDSDEIIPGFLNTDQQVLTRAGPWTAEEFPKLAAWMKKHQSKINILLSAAKYDLCQFELQMDFSILDNEAERSLAFHYWPTLLRRSGNNDFAKGDTDKALEKYLATIQMAYHLSQQHTQSDVMSCSGIIIKTIPPLTSYIISDLFTEEQLSLTEKQIDKIRFDWERSRLQFEGYENLKYKNIETATTYEINSKGEIRFNRDPYSFFLNQFSSSLKPDYMIRKFCKALTIVYWFSPPPSPLQEMEVDLFLSELNDTTKGVYLMAASMKNYGHITIALRRYKNSHGTWPESLDEIKDTLPAELFVDPVNDGSYVYKLFEDDFKLYSKGENNIDEGGDRRTEKADGTKTDDILFWPKRDKKNKTKKEPVNGG